MNKTFSAEFKTNAVLELLREESSLNEISGKYGVHPSQLSQWRKAVKEGIPDLLSDKRKRDSLIKKHEEEVKELYAQIGPMSIW